MGTIKATRQARTQLTASMADLGSIIRLNFDNFNSQPFSFVLDKSLQLKKTPVANPIIKPFSSSLLPYSFQVFHNNFVSIEAGNNLLAYVVVYPSHEPLLSARDFPKQSSGTLSAFGLKFSTNKSESSFSLFDFVRVEKLAVGSDCKVVYSEVNAKNSVLQSRGSINLFGKRKQEEASSFSVNPQDTFINIPIEIFLVAEKEDASSCLRFPKRLML